MENDASLFSNSSNSNSEYINHSNVEGFIQQRREEKGTIQYTSNTSAYSAKPQNLHSNEMISGHFENEFDAKIGIKRNDDINNYRQLVYEYYSKSEDLESKCTMLHKNLQEMKEAWEKTKISKDLALKEKENMTLKYAKGERKMLHEKDLKEKAEKRCEELSKEIESLQRKLQIKNQEKTRITSMYDNKTYELKAIQSDNNRITNENCILKNELKLCQNALKNQAELYKKAQNTIEDLNERIEKFSEKEKEEEKLQIKLKEIELERNEKDQQLQNLQKCFDDLSSKHHTLEDTLFTYEDHLQLQEFSDKETDKENTKKIYESDKRFEEFNESLNLLKIKNEDLENDIQLCRIKEFETLLFNKQLSEKNAELQSENINFQNIIEGLTDEKYELREQCKRFNEEFTILSKQFASEKETSYCDKKKFLLELDSLTMHLAEQNRQNMELKQQLFDQQQEFLIMKKKYNTSLRELRREIKLHKYGDSISLSACPSYLSTTSKETEQSYNPIKTIQPENILDQNVLTERIVRLQKISVRKSEKIDFLQDQIETLLKEVRKKDNLLQFYFLQEPTETLVSNEMSNAKFSLSKLGGIMASLYDARIADESLTLELLLEINCKLQAVLEDVLLKNIILKNNIAILGEEIEKLNNQLKNGG